MWWIAKQVARLITAPLITLVMLFELATLSAKIQAEIPAQPEPAFQPTSEALGEGYASDRLQTTGFSCLASGQQHFQGAAATTINFGGHKSFEDLQKSLNVNLSATASYDIFTANAAVGFVRSVRKSRLSESWYFIQQTLLPRLVLTPAGYSSTALNDIGSQAMADGEDSFRHVCGDRFTREIRYGAGLFVAIKLNFNSIFDRTAFESSANLKVASIFGLLSSIEAEARRSKINGNIEVVAYQRGGDPRRLSRVFSKSEKGYHVSSCNLDNMKACLNILDGILAYAGEDFRNQLMFANGKMNGAAYIVSRDYKPYDQLGLAVGPSMVSDEVIAIRKRLGELFISTREKEEFVRQLLYSRISNHLSLTARSVLDSVHKALTENLSLLSSPGHGVIRCYNSPESCALTEQKLLNNLSSVDDAVIEEFKVSYSFRNRNNNPGFALPIGNGMYVYYYPYNDQPSLVNLAAITLQGDRLKVLGKDRHFSISGFLSRQAPDYFSGTITINKVPETYTYTRVDNPIFLDSDSVFCYDVVLKHDGFYVLSYETLDNTSACGGKSDATMNKGDYVSLRLAPGAMLKLRAVAGESTTITANQSGTLQCKGTTIAGFGCSWVGD